MSTRLTSPPIRSRICIMLVRISSGLVPRVKNYLGHRCRLVQTTHVHVQAPAFSIFVHH
ncbi:hypothetical protein BDZ94DRAFT_1269149 [Collybia nuda]|uniref:Uncharacterized protein n=1 Tax=Collybia nuda TaxID=64659 RepID=A0A9P5Y0J3_9AGAR|nr:hypothetical protein BDZ94DRAFT_1269149 [Collybia nuda]